MNYFLSTVTYLFLSISTTCSDNQSMFIYGTCTPTSSAQVHELYDSVTAYPRVGFTNNTHAHQMILNRTTKVMPPEKSKPIFQKSNLSILHPKPGDFENYPSGSSIFVQADVAQTFDVLINLIKQKPYILSFLRKIHINAINQLYHHLIGVYVNMNLQQFGMQLTPKGVLQLSVPLYLQQENNYHTNIKMLIIDHLINIIESQFNGAIRAYAPKVPQSIASYAGRFAICNDYSVDLTKFIEQQLSPELAEHKKEYLQALATDMRFFSSYTQYLYKPHTKQPQHFTQFLEIAQKLAQDLASKKLELKPAFFHFNFDDIAALKVIPYLAKQLPTTSLAVEWPEQIVQAANNGVVLQPNGQPGHPIAYFRTSDGRVVKNLTQSPTDGRLYICLRAGQNLFEEEVIAQPDWLNSWSGIAKVLQACYGDLQAIAELNIVDPCTQHLINNGIKTVQGKDANSEQAIASCISHIEQQKPKKISSQVTTAPLIAATPNATATTTNALTNILLNQPNS